MNIVLVSHGTISNCNIPVSGAQKGRGDNTVEKPCKEIRAKISQIWQKTSSYRSKELSKPQVG